MRINCLIMVLLLQACYEESDVILHEPGIYKGKVDDHEQSPEQRAALWKKRFNQVQTDR